MENFFRLGILLFWLAVIKVLTADITVTNNDVISDVNTTSIPIISNVTTTSSLTSTAPGTLMDTLCFGQPFTCTCLQKQEDPTMTMTSGGTWQDINCSSLGMTEIPSWNETRDERMMVGAASVSFESNQLTKVFEMNGSDVIEALSFDDNHIDALGAFAFQRLTNLKVLSIRGNRLDKIGHRDFHTATADGSLALEVLDLRDNTLVHVDDDAFEQLPRLRILRLSNNPIHALDLSTVQALNSVHGLRSLHLGHAQLTQLPSTQLVNPMRNLLELDLSYNRLARVPEALQSAVQLVKLNLDGNPMLDLDAMSFVGLIDLEQLDINNMTNLETIYGGTFTLLTKLTKLRCSDNVNLSGIETEAFFDRHGDGTTSLKTITLRNNNLRGFNEETFSRMPNVTLDLEDNPLHCSCNQAWLNISHGDLRCNTPKSLSGRRIRDVDFRKTMCSNDNRNKPHGMMYLGFAVSMGALLLVLVVGVGFMIARRARLPYPSAHYRRAQNNEACDLFNE